MRRGDQGAGPFFRYFTTECEILAEELERLDVNQPQLLIDGHLHHRVLRSSETYLSAAGAVKVWRTLYRRGRDGAVVPLELTGGARKIRFAAKGKGKSGGYRVITFYGGAEIPVFLLNVFVKNQKVDLTQAERNELKGVLSDLAEAYRKKKVHHA